MSGATIFTAGIVKGLKEHNDARRHFGSLMSFQHHLHVAESLGLIERGTGMVVSLTAAGEDYYTAKNLGALPDCRAYFWAADHSDEFWAWPDAKQKGASK